MDRDGWTYIFLRAGRKAWHHDVPKSWQEIAFERGDHIECAIFRKRTDELTEQDKVDWLIHGEAPAEEWLHPYCNEGIDCGFCSKCLRKAAQSAPAGPDPYRLARPDEGIGAYLARVVAELEALRTASAKVRDAFHSEPAWRSADAMQEAIDEMKALLPSPADAHRAREP